MSDVRPGGLSGAESIPRRRIVAAVDMASPPRIPLGDADGVHMVVTLLDRAIGVASVLRPVPSAEALESAEIGHALNARLGSAAWNALLVGRVHDRLGRWWEQAPRPSVTVAVCTRDRPHQIAGCLESLSR